MEYKQNSAIKTGCHYTTRPRLQPAFEAYDEQCPGECKTGDCNGNVEEHHDIISASAHSGNGDFLRGKDENKTTTCEEKATEAFSRRSRRKDGSWRAKPQEKVRQTS